MTSNIEPEKNTSYLAAIALGAINAAISLAYVLGRERILTEADLDLFESHIIGPFRTLETDGEPTFSSEQRSPFEAMIRESLADLRGHFQGPGMAD